MRIAILGFGEAAQTFVGGWGARRPRHVRAYDVKTTLPSARAEKLADYARCGIARAETAAEALGGADLVLSLVTADQALAVARDAAPHLAAGAIFCDMNSVAPETKRLAAAALADGGGRYVDTAVMAPVHPDLTRVPLLLSGPDAAEALSRLERLGHGGRVLSGETGAASTVKMLRSIMVKGMEALTAECLLAAEKAGLADEVIASLDGSFPGWDWARRADYNLDRMLVHGLRRSAEMQESARTAAGILGIDAMAAATARWQARIGAIAVTPPPCGFAAKADIIIERMQQTP